MSVLAKPPVMASSYVLADGMCTSSEPLVSFTAKPCKGRKFLSLPSSSFVCSSRNSILIIRREFVSPSRRPLITTLASSSPPPNLGDEGPPVQDMEVLLNNLSLEYESVWDTKPGWCQPWSILLTGCIAVLVSWLVLRSVIVTALVTAGIGAWWYIFLYSYPQAYTEMIAARRQRIRDGDEDTYGSKMAK